MKQEDKDLLLKDLCARLPYGVMADYENHTYVINEIDPACKDIDYITVRIQDVERLMCAESVMIENIKIYLRPLSSMTEEESKEYRKTQITKWVKSVDCTYGGYYEHRDTFKTFDWLNAHHFDYRGLIEKGLAIEVTEENNPYKTELS